MSTVMAPDTRLTGPIAGQEAARPSRHTTTLYDVIAALQDGVGPEEDTQVVATVVHLLRSEQLTELRADRVRRGAAPRAVKRAGESLPRDCAQGGGHAVA
jgi:hypothetical protein